MVDRPVTLACEQTDRTWALFNGDVRPNGIDLTLLALQPEEMFWRMLRHEEFDVAEISMSSYLIAVDQGQPDLTAIPVFPSRSFRHSSIYIAPDGSVDDPSDLDGARVGVPEYQLTAILWVRGMLQDEYDISASDIHWVHGGEEEGGREEKVALSLPESISIEACPPDRTLNDLLEAGEIDAIIAPRVPSTFREGSAERLFPDFRTAERDYYERTGFFPIMHTVAFRREVYDGSPWMAKELLKAFTMAKDQCLDRIDDTSELATALPWLIAEVEATRSLMGHDYWPYGVDANRETLEAMTRYAYEQGLTDTRLAVDDLFAPNTYDDFRI